MRPQVVGQISSFGVETSFDAAGTSATGLEAADQGEQFFAG